MPLFMLLVVVCLSAIVGMKMGIFEYSPTILGGIVFAMLLVFAVIIYVEAWRDSR